MPWFRCTNSDSTYTGEPQIISADNEEEARETMHFDLGWDPRCTEITEVNQADSVWGDVT
jgi:hypothetical protein